MTFKIGKYQFKAPPIVLKALYDKIVIRRKNTLTLAKDKIIMKGEVWFNNGGKDTRHFRNHFVLNGLFAFINLFSCDTVGSNNYPSYHWATAGFTDGTITCGTDLTHPTTASMTALTAPIGGGIGTIPNAQSGTTGSTATSGYVLWSVSFNAGYAGTVGEVGLFMFVQASLIAFEGGINAVARTLVSRLSVADSDFVAQVINTSYAFTVNWQLNAAFA